MMRAAKTIRIGGDGEAGQDITIYELSLLQMPDALAVLAAVLGDPSNPQGVEAMASAALNGAGEHSRRLLHGATSLGAEIDGLGGVALLDIIEAWVEVNTAFFDRLRAMTGKLAASPTESGNESTTSKKKAA